MDHGQEEETNHPEQVSSPDKWNNIHYKDSPCVVTIDETISFQWGL